MSTPATANGEEETVRNEVQQDCNEDNKGNKSVDDSSHLTISAVQTIASIEPNAFVFHAAIVTRPAVTSPPPTIEQLHPFLVRIDVDGVKRWKVYRDSEGLYSVHNEMWAHFAAEHVINLKITATYDEILTAIEDLNPRVDRPGVRGVENSLAYHRMSAQEKEASEVIEVDKYGRWQVHNTPTKTKPKIPLMPELQTQLKVSSAIELLQVGFLLDVPGSMGYVQIDGTDPKQCATVMKLVANRGWKDVLVASYGEKKYGKKLRF